MSVTANKVPQKSDFEKAEKCKKIEEMFKKGTMAISLMAAVYGLTSTEIIWIDIGIAIITLLLSTMLFFTQWKFTKTYRKAERVRREGFLDNAFDTKMADISSEEYYDTDGMDFGIKKLLSNLYENSLYSASISGEMIKHTEKKVIACAIVMLLFSILNLCGTQFVVALADIILSSNIYREYLELKTLNEDIEIVKDECKRIADSYKPKYHSTDNKTMALIIRAYVRYETAMAYASIMLDSNIFNDLNEQLLTEWGELKKRYCL